MKVGRIGWLPVVMLGAAALVGWPRGLAQTATAQPPAVAPRPQETSHLQEVVVSAARDQAITAKVEQTLRDDPYVYAGHISVVTENGIVRLTGVAFDLGDLNRMLYLARKASGSRRIVCEVDLMVDVEAHD